MIVFQTSSAETNKTASHNEQDVFLNTLCSRLWNHLCLFTFSHYICIPPLRLISTVVIRKISFNLISKISHFLYLFSHSDRYIWLGKSASEINCTFLVCFVDVFDSAESDKKRRDAIFLTNRHQGSFIEILVHKYLQNTVPEAEVIMAMIQVKIASQEKANRKLKVTVLYRTTPSFLGNS